MDISALSLAFGAPVEQTGQTTAQPGFDAAIEQAKNQGFIPPGAPPGPEPPPDILVAGEGVEVAEPNAQPQELDFHPLPKVEIDIDLPQPFWKPSVNAENARVETDEGESVDDAMKWLVGQMGCYFFEEPPLAPDCPVLNVDGERTPPSVGKTVICFPADPDVARYDLATPEAKAQTDPTLARPHLESKEIPEGATAPAIDGKDIQTFDKEVLEKLNPTSVKTTFVQLDRVGGARPTEETPVVPEPITPVNPGLSMDKSWKPGRRTDVARPEPTPHPELTGARPVPENPEPRPMKPAESADTDAPSLASADTAPKSGKSDANGEQSKGNGMPKRFEGLDHRTEVSKEKLFGAKDALIDTEPQGPLSSSASVGPVQSVVSPTASSLQPKEADLVVKQVADKLHMLAAARPRNGVVIHLNPEHLGSITVVVKSVGRMVDTQITASDSRVSEALDQNRLRLIEAMDSRGFQLQSVTVSQQSGNATQQDANRGWQQPSQQQHQGQSGQSQGHAGQGERPFNQPKADVRAWVRRGQAVDLAA